jgi:hypothetical protein
MGPAAALVCYRHFSARTGRSTAAAQPINALGLCHRMALLWGMSDYKYLRNGMAAATGSGMLLLTLVEESAPPALTWIWVITAIVVGIRALGGILRLRRSSEIWGKSI